jgi:hypothetical protein
MFTKGHKAGAWFGACLFLFYAAVILAHHQPPSLADSANWTYQGVLLARHLRGLPDAAHVLKMYPVPNSAGTLGVGMLTLMLPWAWAAKIWLCVQLAVFYAALWALMRASGTGDAAWWIAPQAIFLSVNWWYGFHNFELGLAWVLLLAALLLRRLEDEILAAWPIGAVLVLTFFTHMIPFTFGCLLLLGFAAQTRRWRVLWQALPTALLSTWYLVGRYLMAHNADGQAGMVSPVRDYSTAFWAYKVNSYVKSFGFVNPVSDAGSVAVTGLGRSLFLALLAANSLLCLLLGWLLLRETRRAYREKSPQRFLWTAALALVPMYLLAPGTALGVSDPGSRLLQTSLALMIVLGCRAGGRLLQCAAVCGCVLSIAGLLLFVRDAYEPESIGTDLGLPTAVAQFDHVPNHDMDHFYRELDAGNYGLETFPTGMFLNETPK